MFIDYQVGGTHCSIEFRLQPNRSFTDVGQRSKCAYASLAKKLYITLACTAEGVGMYTHML